MKSVKTFQFTLVLKNTDEDVLNIEDSLYEAGCNDALIHSRNGTLYLTFDRESTSLEEAVISAIKNVQSATISLEIASVGPENLVTESEIAKRLNKSRQTISLWIKRTRRKSFPHPVMRLAEKSPLWHWHEVVDWLYLNHLIDDQALVDHARFFANINAVLEERDQETRNFRHRLLEKIGFQDVQRY